MLDILPTVDAWLREGRKIALATVVETWGSAPRQPGAKMAVCQDLAMIGSVSGGCVETAVVQEALACLGDGQPRLLHYGVSDDTAWEVGLACGGRISILVEPLDTAWWQVVAGLIRQDCAAVTVWGLAGAAVGQKLVVSGGAVVYASAGMSAQTQADFAAQAGGYTQSDHLKTDTLDVLMDVYTPRPRLVIVGGAHVAMALKQFADVLGFRVVLVDPRRAFATPERFPDVELISHQYPDKALPDLGLTAETYIAILTHDPKIDDPALRVALPSAAQYIGVLSSRRTHEQRIKRLMESGVDPALLARIRTPIGIDIGAKTPEEVALCIMAEIIAVRNGAL